MDPSTKLKNCSACGTKHFPLFGGYCKNKKDTKAEPVELIPSREDPAYITYLEGQLAAAKGVKSAKEDTLQTIMDRLDKLEINTTATRLAASTAVSTAPTTTTTAAVTSVISGTTWGAPWSAPPFPSTSPWSTVTTQSAWSNPRVTPMTTHAPPGFGFSSVNPLPPLPPFARQSSGYLPPAPAPTPTPASVVNAPLTSVLEQLSQAIDPSISTQTKGIQLRPEYYVQHVDKGVAINCKALDHTKLSYRELVSGMARVLEYLVSVNGEATSYLEHMNFLTKQASVHSFVDHAYVAYDRAVVDRVINQKSRVFVAGDVLAVASHFHAGNLQPVNSVVKKQSARGRGFGSFGRGRKTSASDTDRDTSVPEGFPSDICYNYNYKSCSGSGCQKQHVCRSCKGNHRAQGCQEKSSQSASKK